MNAPRPDFAAARATGATAFLVQEHVVISSVVEVLRVMARRIAGGGDVAPEDAREAAFFFSDFADGAHHDKEERLLFPAMEAAGLPSNAGPTFVMRQEHELGRARVRAMKAALDASPPDLAAFGREAAAFAHLLRDHIAKEDQVLFPMADQLIDAETKDALRARFAEEDPAVGERYTAVAARLSLAYAD